MCVLRVHVIFQLEFVKQLVALILIVHQIYVCNKACLQAAKNANCVQPLIYAILVSVNQMAIAMQRFHVTWTTLITQTQRVLLMKQYVLPIVMVMDFVRYVIRYQLRVRLAIHVMTLKELVRKINATMRILIAQIIKHAVLKTNVKIIHVNQLLAHLNHAR
jgi:hypothetical protein